MLHWGEGRGGRGGAEQGAPLHHLTRRLSPPQVQAPPQTTWPAWRTGPRAWPRSPRSSLRRGPTRWGGGGRQAGRLAAAASHPLLHPPCCRLQELAGPIDSSSLVAAPQQVRPCVQRGKAVRCLSLPLPALRTGPSDDVAPCSPPLTGAAGHPDAPRLRRPAPRARGGGARGRGQEEAASMQQQQQPPCLPSHRRSAASSCRPHGLSGRPGRARAPLTPSR